MLRHLSWLSLVGLMLASVPSVAQAAVGESCTVSLHAWSGSVVCTGLLYEAAFLTWCPNHPTIDCFNPHVLTCTVSTTRPVLLCPLP